MGTLAERWHQMDERWDGQTSKSWCTMKRGPAARWKRLPPSRADSNIINQNEPVMFRVMPGQSASQSIVCLYTMFAVWTYVFFQRADGCGSPTTEGQGSNMNGLFLSPPVTVMKSHWVRLFLIRKRSTKYNHTSTQGWMELGFTCLGAWQCHLKLYLSPVLVRSEFSISNRCFSRVLTQPH